MQGGGAYLEALQRSYRVETLFQNNLPLPQVKDFLPDHTAEYSIVDPVACDDAESRPPIQ
ncbi:hypothetical protein ACHMW4_20580 [Mesorhizobium sp. UC22_110]|uniref:hypothetical protein n=1 Tax=Mesorhizobium sp. UC22_110 TaxID=3374552 RepID=UPI0037584AC6